MLQVYVYDDNNNRYELDLYEEEPLKLNLAIEELADIPKVNSAFSRQFRIPATQKNSQVFRWWYEVNTVDFDVTRRVVAEIYVDGLFYKSGHMRIEGAYINEESTQVDLEVVFYGETRDFASQVGEIVLNQLNLSDYDHILNEFALWGSWNNLDHPYRYVLADRGYIYDSSGSVTSNTIAVADWQNRFTQPNHAIEPARFTPLVQVKTILRAIFAQTSYTWADDSLFEGNGDYAWFNELYTDGITAAQSVINIENSDNHVAGYNQPLPTGTPERVDFTTFLQQGSGWDLIQDQYQVGITDSTYDITVTVNIADAVYDLSGYYELNVYKKRAGITTLLVGTPGAPGASQDSFTIPPFMNTAFVLGVTENNVSLQAGDLLWAEVVTAGGAERPIIIESNFIITGTPIYVNLAKLLKADVKCIDFLKGILTKFKCVMAPTNNEYEFTIKPWQDYIGSGDLLDWTEKLDVNKDVVLSPVFYEQAQLINFKDQPDDDHYNKPFQEEYNRTYGELQFNSGNTLLNDTRDVTTIFAPTPLNFIEGADELTSEFIIPFFCRLGDERTTHGHLQHIPMKVKPRLLFWNGIAPIAQGERWYYTDGAGTTYSAGDLPLSLTTTGYGYPRASDLLDIPSLGTTLNLNWFRETPYWERAGFSGTSGSALYEAFWNEFIQELYSPLARKMTAYFNLNSQDLKELNFDDQIFVKNSYWRVIKVYDAPLTETSTVKVDMVKILDTIRYANDGDPTPTGGGIDDVVVVGSGGATPLSSYYYYEVEPCINPGDLTYITRHTSPLSIGQSVKMSGVIHADICYEVRAVATGPNETIVLETFSDCFSCNE